MNDCGFECVWHLSAAAVAAVAVLFVIIVIARTGVLVQFSIMFITVWNPHTAFYAIKYTHTISRCGIWFNCRVRARAHAFAYVCCNVILAFWKLTREIQKLFAHNHLLCQIHTRSLSHTDSHKEAYRWFSTNHWVTIHIYLLCIKCEPRDTIGEEDQESAKVSSDHLNVKYCTKKRGTNIALVVHFYLSQSVNHPLVSSPQLLYVFFAKGFILVFSSKHSQRGRVGRSFFLIAKKIPL